MNDRLSFLYDRFFQYTQPEFIRRVMESNDEIELKFYSYAPLSIEELTTILVYMERMESLDQLANEAQELGFYD